MRNHSFLHGKKNRPASNRHTTRSTTFFEPLENRQLLSVSAPHGFGANTTGGAGGPTVTATNATDFITYAKQTGPLTIQVQGTINFGGVHVAANKTIIGLGTNATLDGDLGLYTTSNIIVQNLFITNSTNGGEGDGITIKDSTHDVWVDHCTFFDSPDGECDITNQSDFVTVSWSKFYYTRNNGHNFTMLIGSSDSKTTDAGKLHVTLDHNWWSTMAVERMPRVRFGQVHVYDNYYNAPGNNYCIRAAIGSQLLVENNSFEDVKTPWEIYVTSGTTGKIKTTGNLLVNTTDNNPAGTDTVFTPPYAYTLDNASDVKSIVMNGAGAGKLTNSTSTTYQAESATLGGGTTIDSDHTGFTGTGFANLPTSGGFVDWTVKAPTAGTYALSFRYALASGSRNVQLTVNGKTITGGVTFTSTGDWAKWGTVVVPATLAAGTNTVRVTSTGQDSGNIDSLTVSPQATPVIYQAESAALGGGTTIDTNYTGYTGTGFANLPVNGGTVNWTVKAAAAGSYTVTFRYALASGSRNVSLKVNGTAVTGGVTFNSTGSWSNWGTVSISANLLAGSNSILVSSIGQDGGNIDYLSLS